jgi:hypothetical protein
MKAMVNPNEAITAENTKNREIYEFLLTLIIILATMAGLYFFVYQNDGTSKRYLYEIIFTVIIGLSLITSAGLGIFSKDTNTKMIAGWMGVAATVAGFLFFLWFFVIFPPPLTTECGNATLSLLSPEILNGTEALSIAQAKAMTKEGAQRITVEAAKKITPVVAAALCPAAASAIPLDARFKMNSDAIKELKLEASVNAPTVLAVPTLPGWSTSIKMGGFAVVCGLIGFIVGNLI